MKNIKIVSFLENKRSINKIIKYFKRYIPDDNAIIINTEGVFVNVNNELKQLHKDDIIIFNLKKGQCNIILYNDNE